MTKHTRCQVCTVKGKVALDRLDGFSISWNSCVELFGPYRGLSDWDTVDVLPEPTKFCGEAHYQLASFR